MGKNARRRAEVKHASKHPGRILTKPGPRSLPALLVIWGMPGSGKSTYAGWLRRWKAATHIDTDALINKLPYERTTLEQAWYATFTRQMAPASFMGIVGSHSAAVVVEFGLWATPHNIQLLSDLHELGAELAWFEGDHLAAKAAWRRENLRRRRYLRDGLWDEVVAMMDSNRQLLLDVFGPDRMLRTIESSRKHMPADKIHAALFGQSYQAA